MAYALNCIALQSVLPCRDVAVPVSGEVRAVVHRAYAIRPYKPRISQCGAEVCCMVRAAVHRAYAIRPYKSRISQCGAVVYGEILAVAYRAYAMQL